MFLTNMQHQGLFPQSGVVAATKESWKLPEGIFVPAPDTLLQRIQLSQA